jgi:hypothetical protein
LYKSDHQHRDKPLQSPLPSSLHKVMVQIDFSQNYSDENRDQFYGSTLLELVLIYKGLYKDYRLYLLLLLIHILETIEHRLLFAIRH